MNIIVQLFEKVPFLPKLSSCIRLSSLPFFTITFSSFDSSNPFQIFYSFLFKPSSDSDQWQIISTEELFWVYTICYNNINYQVIVIICRKCWTGWLLACLCRLVTDKIPVQNHLLVQTQQSKDQNNGCFLFKVNNKGTTSLTSF